MSQNILITGASSGFGKLIARTLVAAGHTVFATMRDADGRNAEVARELELGAANASGKLHILELDVTDDASVEAAVSSAVAKAGSLDVVVNNAGVGCGGLAEGFTAAQWQQIFDINVFGVQRVCRAVLPAMRKAGAGLIIQISSVMGRIILPYSAPYTATKYALEGMSETLRYELAPTGVEVSIVEPGGFGTDFASRMMHPEDRAAIESYGELAEKPEKMWSGFMEQLSSADAPDPQLVADAVTELIDAPAGSRALRVVVDPMMGGEAPRAINQTTDRIQAQILANLGTGGDAAPQS